MKPLTDEQVCEALLAQPAVPAEDAEVSALQSALGSYRAEALHWAERRSAAQPSLAAVARRSERWAAIPRWSLATIALVTIAAGVAHVSEQRGITADMAAATQVSVSQNSRVSAEDLAADNKLLNSINDELSYHAHSPIDAIDLKQSSARVSRTSQDASSEE